MQYAQIAKVNTMTKLARELVEKTGKKLSQATIAEVLVWKYNGGNPAGCKEGDVGYGEFTLADVKPSVEVVESPEEFAKVLRLVDFSMEHSWAGEHSIREWGFSIVGDATFGRDIDQAYYNNGNLTSEEKAIAEGNFDASIPQVVLVNREESDHYNGNCRDSNTCRLVVYLPPSALIDPNVLAIAEAFRFLPE